MVCSASKISGGGYRSLAILSNGSLFTFGDNQYGQFGNGNNNSSNVPIRSMEGMFVSSVAAGYGHSLVILSNGSFFTFGLNSYGQLGNGNNVDSNVPVLRSIGGMPTSSMAGGHYHSLVILSNGSLFTFGYDFFGQLGNGNNVNSNVPILIFIGGLSASAVACGLYHSLVILSNGSLFTFGRNGYGELGNGNTNNSKIPILISTGGISASLIGGGYQHSLLVGSNGSLFTFGNNSLGQLGTGNNIDSNVPLLISIGGISISLITVGYDHSLVVLSNGSLLTFGRNDGGQLGIGINSYSKSVPSQIPITGTTAAIAAGWFHSLIILSNGTLLTFGRNVEGQLGNGNNNNSKVPIQILCRCTAPNITNAPTPSCVEGTIIPSNSYCTTICNNGYTPNISNLLCNDGSFSPSTSWKCEPNNCTSPIGISNSPYPSCFEGITISSGSNCTTQCNHGYSPNISNIICSFGSFSPSTLWKCNPNSCNSPSSISNSPIPSCVEGATITSGFHCTTQCNVGYSPSINNVSCHLGSISSWYCIPIHGCPTFASINGVEELLSSSVY